VRFSPVDYITTTHKVIQENPASPQGGAAINYTVLSGLRFRLQQFYRHLFSIYNALFPMCGNIYHPDYPDIEDTAAVIAYSPLRPVVAV